MPELGVSYPVLEGSKSEHGLADADGRVEGGTAVGSRKLDHGAEDESDQSTAEEVDPVSVDMRDILGGDVVLNKENRANKNEGAEGFDAEGLLPGVKVYFERGEIIDPNFAIISRLSFQEAEEDVHGGNGTQYLRADHDDHLQDARDELVFSIPVATFVDEHTECHGRVQVPTGDGSRHQEHEEEGNTTAGWITL